MAGLPLPAGEMSPRDALIAQIRAQGGGSGTGSGNWDDAGFDRAGELADLLMNAGVTNLGDLSFKDVVGQRWEAGMDDQGNAMGGEWTEGVLGRQLMIGDKAVGYLGDYNNDGTYGSKAQDTLKGIGDEALLGWSARGDGNTSYRVITDPNTGKLVISPGWNSSSDASDFQKAAKFYAAAAAAGYGITAMAGAGAAGGTGVNLGMGGATAGDFGMIAGANGAATYGGIGAAEAAGLAGAAGTAGTAGASSGVLGSWGEWGFDPSQLLSSAGKAGGDMSWLDIVQAGINVGGLVKDYMAVDAATDAANDSNALSREVAMKQLGMTEKQYNDYVTNIQPLLMDAMKTSTDNAKTTQEQSTKLFNLTYDDAERYSQRWRDVQVPLEDEIIGNARKLGTQDEQNRLAGLAMADVRGQYADMRAASDRRSNRMGLNPASAAAQALAAEAFQDEALAGSAAMTGTRFAAQDRYRAGLTDAAALGRGLPGFASSAASAGTAATSAGISAGSSGVTNLAAGINANTGALNGFTNGWNGAANSANNGITGLIQAGQLSNNSALSTLAGLGWSNWTKPPKG